MNNCKHSTQNLSLEQLEGITEITPHAQLYLFHHIHHNQIIFTPLPTTRTPTPIQILADWGDTQNKQNARLVRNSNSLSNV